MPESSSEVRGWLSHQVAKYTDVHPVYRQLAATLQRVLEDAAASETGHAIVQTRPKTVASFAEKALRKRSKYSDPVNQFTDLCGARVITRTGPEVEAIGRFLEDRFEIDRENTVDTSSRLRPTEFGYRSVHYIVSFEAGGDYGIEIPSELLRHPVSPREDADRARRLVTRPPKAEVQVRTLLEHSYADFVHDLSYKGAFDVPDVWLRKLAGAAASLERVGETFDTLARRLEDYASSYGSYLPEDELARETETLRIILEHDPDNAALAARLGKLLIAAGDWDGAIELLTEWVREGEPGILRDLGVALCKRHRTSPGSEEYRRGQAYLERAAAPEQGDVDAICSYAGTWKGIDETRVHELYRRAFEVDPGNAYALENYLECELQRDTGVVEHTRPQIQRAIERCQSHIEVGINLPWAFYSLGRFHLLLGDPYRSLDAYARGMAASSAPFMVETALASLDRLAGSRWKGEGLEWARRLLALGVAARELAAHENGEPGAGTRPEGGPETPEGEGTPTPAEPSPAMSRLISMATPGAEPLMAPLTIVVGGADPRLEERMATYRELLLGGFADYGGTIISGGTTQGVPGLVGELGLTCSERIHTVGYLPAFVPSGATVDRRADRYHELRSTEGRGFTPLEPLQNWIDLLVSGIGPDEVKVVGINGGRIAAIEYRIALALGADVAVIADSGREVGRLTGDAYWSTAPRLLTLPGDPETLRAFLGGPPSSDLPGEVRDSLARAIHEEYRENRASERLEDDLALRPWEELPDSLKASNRAQVLDIERKLRFLGYEIRKADGDELEPAPFSDDEVEQLARMEHGRWNVERLADGWERGEVKDVPRKISPHLLPWSELPESIQERDREAVRKIPELLEGVGLTVRRRV
ncbi:MAG: RyR domain-containing protein [Gemmatimonadota bacterium]|jgi:ppGpp synthetase/RelA/SpoT-type nucleotidyltranferase